MGRIVLPIDDIAEIVKGGLESAGLRKGDPPNPNTGEWVVKQSNGDGKPADPTAEKASQIFSRVADLAPMISAAGQEIGESWRRSNYNERDFPELAESILLGSGLGDAVSIESLANYLIEKRLQHRPGPNVGTSFGQPAVTLYSDPDAGSTGFVIEALIWLDSTTSIHDHGFSGAFMVAQGSSLHSTFTFTAIDHVRADLLLGDLKWKFSEILLPGDARQIKPGAGFIHSLFHMDHPSVTLVARTYSDRWVAQHSYHPPGVAFNDFHDPEPLATQLKMLSALGRTGSSHFESVAFSLIDDADLWTTRRVLNLLYRQRDKFPFWTKLVAAATERHGRQRIDALLSAAAATVRSLDIVKLRMSIHQPEHRFLLALLLNVPDRSSIRSMIIDRNPGSDPDQKILDWLTEMGGSGYLGFTPTPISMLLLKMMLKDATLADACLMLSQVLATAELSDYEDELYALWHELHSTPLLQSIVSDVTCHRCEGVLPLGR